MGAFMKVHEYYFIINGDFARMKSGRKYGLLSSDMKGEVMSRVLAVQHQEGKEYHRTK